MMTRAERRWVWGFAALLLLITTAPYLLGFWWETAEWRFSGFVFGADDGNSYIAKMLRGSTGDWLFRSPYSAAPQTGLAAFLPYLLLGKLAAPPAQHEQLVALFQGFRAAAMVGLALAMYTFAAQFLKEVWQRRLATVLVLSGGGLGWLAPFGLQVWLWGGRLPLEFYSPETFGFLGVFGLPHLAAARALLLAGFVQYLRAVSIRRARPAVVAGALWLAAGLFQPLTVATGWAVLGTFVVLTALSSWLKKDGLFSEALKRAAVPALIAGLVSSPLVLYSLLSMLTDDYLRAWTAQNIILSPPPVDYLLAFLPVLPFAAIGAARLIRRGNTPVGLLLSWVLVFPLLAYAPHNLQRRLPEGIWVVLSILAAAGMGRANAAVKRWQVAALAPGFLPALILLAGAGLAVGSPAAPLYHSAGEVAAFRYLAENAPRDAVVLASFETSNRLPAWAPLRTITGHGPESVRANEIDSQITAIFDPATSSARRMELLSGLGVDYLLYGPGEHELGAWKPGSDPAFAPVYQEGDFVIYAVPTGAP